MLSSLTLTPKSNSANPWISGKAENPGLNFYSFVFCEDNFNLPGTCIDGTNNYAFCEPTNTILGVCCDGNYCPTNQECCNIDDVSICAYTCDPVGTG